MFLKIHEGLRIWFILSSFCDLFVFNVSFNIWSMKNFFKLKTVVNQFYLNQHSTGPVFELCSSFLFVCLRGRYVWFSQWLEFSLGKPFFAGELESPSYLVLTAGSLDPEAVSLGIKRDHTNGAKEKGGKRPHLWNHHFVCCLVFCFWHFEPLSCLCFREHL